MGNLIPAIDYHGKRFPDDLGTNANIIAYCVPQPHFGNQPDSVGYLVRLLKTLITIGASLSEF